MMKLSRKSTPELVLEKAPSLNARTVVTSGVAAVAAMGALTTASAVISALRAKGKGS